MARTAKDPDLGYISGYHYIYREDTKSLTNLRVQGASYGLLRPSLSLLYHNISFSHTQPLQIWIKASPCLISYLLIELSCTSSGPCEIGVFPASRRKIILIEFIHKLQLWTGPTSCYLENIYEIGS